MNKKKDLTNKYCPKCGKPLEIRHGEYGTYLDCTGYPKCKYTQDMSKKIKPKGIQKYKDNVSLPATCPKCTKKLAIYIGVNGAFFGCNGYPDCNFSYNVEDLDNILCPKCGNLMAERTGKYGLFLGCRSYPECKFTYPIRISKTVKSEIQGDTQVRESIKRQPLKKLELNVEEATLSAKNIQEILKNDWLNLDDIATKLRIRDDTDFKFLQMQLKKLEKQDKLDIKIIHQQKFWKMK